MFENKEQLIQYLKENHLYTNKGLGQNFLVDDEALEKIVAAGDIKETDTILEIGPGLGVLTEELSKKAKRVIAIELDTKLYELLELRIKNYELRDRIQIINANALDYDLSKIHGSHPESNEGSRDSSATPQNDTIGSYKLIANIPYYITSKILEKFLTTENKPESIVLLVQKEVAERICARAGGMSVLSISVQAYGEPSIVDIVKAESFFPAPKVDSAILKISNIKYQISKINEKDFFRTVKIGFAARRKTLLNNLSAGYRVDKDTILNILKTVKLDENVRAQELSVENWEQLAAEILKIQPRA